MSIVIDFNEMNKSLDEYTQSIIELVSVQNESLISISSMSREILEWISKYIKKQLENQDSQPTKQEIAEIVNKAISSYSESTKQSIEELNKKIDDSNKHNIEEIDKKINEVSEILSESTKQSIEELNKKIDASNKHNLEELNKVVSESTKQSIEELNKKIDESNKHNTDEINKNIEEANKHNLEELNKKIDESNNQTNKELNLYHTQIIQMFKDLIENVNKLNNKVDRLESIISQKKEVIDVATQTFANGLCSSNKKVYVENILKEDLESQNNVSTNNKKLNKTPLHTSEVNDTILEDITGEKNQQSTTTKQIIIDSSYINKARVINKEEDKKENIDELLKKVNKNINKSKVSESYKKLDLKTVMKASRETTIIKYKEKVGNDYTKEQFKNNTEIGIGCKHRIFLRSDGRITNLNKDIIFNKDIKLEKNTYYIEREGQKYLVFRNINSINNNIPNDSFTLMKLPEGCQKFDNDIIVDILNKVRIGGIDGENVVFNGI